MDSLSYIINHVFLPPKLPQEAETDVGERNSALLKVVRDIAEYYCERKGHDINEQWAPAVKMLTTLGKFDNNGSFNAEAFRKSVRYMESGDVLALHISAQNAGLILRQLEDTMVFESFEASPLTKKVIETVGKLRCSYPGPAISVSLEKVKDTTFLSELGMFLEKMSRDVLEQAAPKAAKAGSTVLEDRETQNPKFITGMLTGILRGIGSPANVERIEKRIADDVLWDNARTPWRRSPIWLVVRVALQTTLRDPCRAGGHKDKEYKSFMVFLMAKLLDLALSMRDVSSDVLFVMNAKLSRRVHKMRKGGLPQYVLVEARRVCDRGHDTLDDRWTQAQQYYTSPFKWNPKSFSAERDVQLSMVNTKKYLGEARNLGVKKRKPNSFTPNESKRINTTSARLPQLGSLKGNPDKELILADFELWVKNNLAKWFASIPDYSKACERLGEEIEDYITAAKPSASSNPERNSVFILTMMELWVTLDKITLVLHPLLSRYYPGFRDDFLIPLLLPQGQQRIRLHKLEEYLKARNVGTYQGNTGSMYSSVVNESSFAVRYFDTSDEHRRLRHQILEDARKDMIRKECQLEDKEIEYEDLLERADGLSCECVTSWEEGWMQHPQICRRCALISSAERMRIEVFEMPLPEEALMQKAVVFELRCPLGFSIWRDMTLHVLTEVCAPPKIPPGDIHEPLEALDTYPGLQRYMKVTQRSRPQRLQWSSFTKSFLKSHYRFVRLPTTIGSLRVNNGLRYGLYDREGGKWTHQAIGGYNIRNSCAFRLPDGPYKKLQYTLTSTTHTPNAVISRQSECPVGVQLHEYIGFGLVRSGHRVQWLNILRELRGRTLTFNSDAVNMLFSQCAWQAGPQGPPGCSKRTRESHVDLEDEGFGRSILSELVTFLAIIKSNWQEVTAVQTLIMLATQLLTFGSHESITRGASSFLRDARRVCLGWTRELNTKLRDCKPQEMRELRLRIVQVAAVCRETYNAEEEHLDGLLHSRKDVAVLVECAIIIHDNVPAINDALPRPLRILLDRGWRLSHAIEAHVRSLILKPRIGLDLTCVWSAYGSKCSWISLAAPNTRWVVSMAMGSGNRFQQVYYNLLTGKLLVDGLPLGKLPLDYVSHPTYVELFGEKVLDVYPSKMDGMVFQTQVMNGHDVGFAMHGNELIIRIQRRTDSVVHQLIPRAKLRGDFPGHIIAGHLHWLELSTNKIELRDQKRQWEPEHSRYISDTMGSAPSVLYLNKDQRLVDVRSETTEAINLVLAPLEYKTNIDVRYGKDGVVSAHLPRLKLDFFINRGQKLECRQFPGMVVDSDPNIGTLFGLENRLVVSQGSSRSVLIPYGKVKFEQFEKDHVRVEIDTRGEPWVRYHIYTIDTVLGRLVGNGSLASHLYKIYLHAVTASCLPDTLTSRTGTEEALYLLRTAATWSFQKPEIEGVEAELFGHIQSLTPTRIYYPKHKKSMQKITWSCLSPIAQHDEFSSIVEDVLAHARRFQMFGEGPSGSNPPIFNEEKEPGKLALTKRAAHRNAGFRIYEFGGSIGEEERDAVYEARDVLGEASMDEARACYTSALVERWPSKLNICSNLMGVFEKSGDLGSKTIDMRYDQKWLDQDLAEVWFELYQHLTVSTKEDHTYRLVFLLGAIAYSDSGKTKMDLIESLLAFATVDRFRWLGLPSFLYYNLKQGFTPDPQTLYDAITECFTPFEDSAEADLQARVGESSYKLAVRRDQTYWMNRGEQLKSFVDEVISQWPCQTPQKPTRGFPLLNTSDAMSMVTMHFRNWHRNSDLQRHVRRVQAVLDNVNLGGKRCFQVYSFDPCREVNSSMSGAVLLENLLHKPPPDLPVPPAPIAVGRDPVSCDRASKEAPQHSGFESLLRDFEASKSLGGFWGIYVNGLQESFKVLKGLPISAERGSTLVSTGILESCEAEFKKYLAEVFGAIRKTLLPKRDGKGWMIYRAGLWPRISPMLLLQQLAMNRPVPLSNQWREVLVTYGKAISMLQRSQRLLKHAREGASVDLVKELENYGHEGWDQMEKADWLLMEIENSLLVRPVQVDIALRMISPADGQNTLMQLCMGEGKTSVIVPITAAHLADGEKLVRVVVLKPLIGQMFQMLVQRLGGLVNRRVYFLPFSRGVKMGVNEARLVRELFEECMEKRGILLAQPEHILSFKLLGLERLYITEHAPKVSTKAPRDMKELHAVAQQLLETQRWLRKKSRDILDESDEILSIRHELIYTIGSSRPIEGYPDRWIVIQQILELIRQHLRAAEFSPQEFEVEHSPHEGGFDSIRILGVSAGLRLLKKIASKIIAGHLPAFSFRFLPQHLQKVALRFITDPKLREDECIFLRLQYQDDQVSTGILYLLRGLIAHKLLLYVLHYKRWKVDYGLDPKRSMLAVPYRAKDCPSGQSEFSHPDVAITVTCLSYYYGGLSESQLEICFRDVYKSDNPTMEYERWLERVSVTNFKLRHLNAINLEDRHQWKVDIFPTFRYNKAIIDFYLSGVVFPMEAKEFSKRLSTSGWDIAEKKDFHPTTGFSGTNDNQYLLPLSISQVDTGEQVNTNARVLSYLLQPENTYRLAEGTRGERLNVKQLLEWVTDADKDMKVKVLLDVGAQVLELRNEEVASEWLKIVPESYAKAAVYFNDNDELTVVARDGATEALMISAFAEQLDKCLVYLDEAHTRGTDLKLPSKSRAVVTLGPNLTKDRLVQACMRMRKLGNGHSVLFCGPPEVHRKILALAKKADPQPIEVRDVLHWCMMETCSNARRLLPIWAKQGISHARRYRACNDLRLSFPHILLEQESKSLEEHYGFKRARSDILPTWNSTRKTDGSEFHAIQQKCKDFGVTSFGGAPMLEEQERELSHEIESERVLQRPPKADPMNHQVTRDLRELVDNGNLPPHARRWDTFIPAFRTLRDTSANDYMELASWPETILVTNDFATVIDKRDSTLDEYLRPVNWILSMNNDPSTLIILSPYEVNELLPRIRQSRSVILHMYSPRTAKASPSYDTLDFCTIPRLPKSWQPNSELIDSVNIFAGQLYLSDYETYERICGFLGLYLKTLPQGENVEIGSDGFVEQSSRKSLCMKDSTFTKSPVPFLRALLGMRRKMQSYAATHMGQILNGRSLSKGEFEYEESESREICDTPTVSRVKD
ncbi:hypothetical protein DFP73DRAFT_546547 [Morchella snyderi]|nr:hypothetical protein DFP73DRAFT_546547 [Morchella snyderi]